MTDTLRRLQAIGDGDFETLVTWYLRRQRPELAGLIATGVNEEGKSIPCRVDGILCIPGNPPRCVTVASTTVSRSRLRGKWLGTKKDKGDIAKAAEEFQEWRKGEPEIECTLYLATNRPLKSDIALYRDAVQTGRACKTNIEPIEASLLVDFLDHDPEGQYLREELLGIEANRLSESLLRKIASLSLTHHRRMFAVGQSYEEMEIVRDAHTQLSDLIEQAATALIGLRGVSGTGKSTLIRQVGRKINEERGIALWVRAEDIEPGSSIERLLLKVLHQFHPSLNARAGEDAVHLASTLPSGLVLLVDDVNRLPAPEQTIHGIEAWAAPVPDERGAIPDPRRAGFRFVVPLWPGRLAVSSQSAGERDSKWDYVELHPYSPRERADLAAVLSESQPEQARQVIDALNGDPFLCGLASADMTLSVGVSRSALVQRIFTGVLHRAAEEAAQGRRMQATPNEFVTAVDGLVELMVRREEPEPRWDQVRSVLGDRKADLLHVLGDTNQLGWIESYRGRDIWRWKHDRLRDALVGRWLANHVLLQTKSGNVSKEVRDWLSDPGLAEAWAVAVIFLPNEGAQAEDLALIAEHEPLALAEALRLNLFPSAAGLRQLIAKGLTKALAGFDERTREFVGSPQRWILGNLSETIDPLVLEVTQGVHPSWFTWAARFRNGDISAGLEWMRREAQHEFLPFVNFRLLEQSIEAFARLYDHKRNYVAERLAQFAGRTELTTAVILLAGYLAWPELSWTICKIWDALTDTRRMEVLAPVAWALSRCGDNSIQSELEEVLLLARKLSEDEKAEGRVHHASDRYDQFMEPLWLARRWPISPQSVETWARVAVEYPDLRQTICFVLRGIDDPTAMETYVRWSAEHGGTLWDDAGEPVDPLAEAEHAPRIPRSPAARGRLWEMVEKESDQTTRRIAFSFWKRLAGPSDLEQLHRIPFSDALFDEALRVRLKLRDRTAAPLLVERINAEPTRWCSYAPLLYDEPGVADALLNNLETALGDLFFGPHMIALYLPREAIRSLVREKRELLLRSPLTWLGLWRSDVPDALALVREALAQKSSKGLDFYLTSSGFPFPVSRRMLDALVPFVKSFPETKRKLVAELAVRSGFVEWVQDHLLDVALGSHFWLTAQEVVDVLTAATEMVPRGVALVIDKTRLIHLKFRLEGKHGSAMDLMETIRKWLAASPDGNQLTIAAMLIADFGTSDDISWWESMEPDGEPAHAAWANALYILKRRRWHG